MNNSRLFNTWRQRRTSIEGISMPELIAVISITGVLAAIAAPSISIGTEPLRDSSNQVSAIIKLARTKAMSQTSAYRVSAVSNNMLAVAQAETCDSTTWTNASGFTDEQKTLKKGVIFSAASQNGPVDPASGWSICFDSRGSTDNILSLTLFNPDTNQLQEIEVFRGGTLQVASASLEGMELEPQVPDSNDDDDETAESNDDETAESNDDETAESNDDSDDDDDDTHSFKNKGDCKKQLKAQGISKSSRNSICKQLFG